MAIEKSMLCLIKDFIIEDLFSVGDKEEIRKILDGKRETGNMSVYGMSNEKVINFMKGAVEEYKLSDKEALCFMGMLRMGLKRLYRGGNPEICPKGKYIPPVLWAKKHSMSDKKSIYR